MIINATNAGSRLSGIGKYSLSLSQYFLQYWNYPFKLFVNSRGIMHLKNLKDESRIKLVNRCVSPDYGFNGHLLRLLWTNKLSLQDQNDIIFNTSQLEGCLYHKRQIITVHDLIPLIFQQYHKKQYHYFRFFLISSG